MPYLKRFLTPPGGGVTSSLLAFKIALNKQYTGDSGAIRADQIKIEIELFDSFFGLLNINAGKYASGAYINKYYIEMGNAPQSYAGTTSTISATATGEYWVDNNEYYVNTSKPNIKYVLKGNDYYLVEPIRWIIIADENYPKEGGTYGIDYFSTTNLAAIDRPLLTNIPSRQIVVLSERLLTNFSFTGNYSNYEQLMTGLRDKIFTANEQTFLKTVSLTTVRYNYNPPNATLNENFSLMANYTHESFNINPYLTTPALRQASNTAYLAGTTANPTTFNSYYLRSYHRVGDYDSYYLNESGESTGYHRVVSASDTYPAKGIRPMFVMSLWD